jgi:hypothetical protein
MGERGPFAGGTGVGKNRLLRLTSPMLVAAGWLAAASAGAQVTSDSVPRDRLVPLQEQVQTQMQESRFHLGPFRIMPKLQFLGPSYDSNVFGTSGEDTVSDWTITARAGIGVIVPLGKKVYLRGDILPEYIWYASLTDRRQWGGVYSGSILMFFNRLSFEGDYVSRVTPGYPNSEISAQVLTDSQAAFAKVEVDVTGRISAFAQFAYDEYSFRPLGDEPPPVVGDNLADLDRREGGLRAGMRYKVSPSFDFGVAGEATAAEFPQQPTLADNESTAVLVSVHYDQPRFFVNLSGGYRDGRARNGSSFVPFQTGTGSGYVSYNIIKPLTLDAYGRRGISYSIVDNNPYYLETLGGIAANVSIGSRVTLRGFGEYGTNKYPVLVDGIAREDKLTTYGGGVQISVLRNLSVTASAQNTDYDSNFPGATRSVFRFLSSIVLGDLFGELLR